MRELIVPIKIGQMEVHDESLYSDFAVSYSEPKNEKEVSAIVKECIARGEKITVSGGLTGVNGAAVPAKCHSLNTKNMCNLSYNAATHTVQAGSGTTFKELELFLAKESKGEWEFPVSPTEKTASIGGALSFGTTGLRSFAYGPVFSFIEEIEYCDATGNLNKICCGDDAFTFFKGKEGMLGIITEVTLKTIKKKPIIWSIMFFFPDDESAAKFSDLAAVKDNVEIVEYIDKACFELCESYRHDMSILEGIPSMPKDQECAIMVEIHSETEDLVAFVAESLMENSSILGGNPELSWAMEGSDIEKLRNLRHAISECINMSTALVNTKDLRIQKLSIDIQWKDKTREWILDFYRKTLQDSGIKYCIFGHIGTFSPYVSFLVSCIEEYEVAKKMANLFYCEAKKCGGNIFSELGVGKLNKSFFCDNSTTEEVDLLITTKMKYDSENFFNPTNMFMK